MILTTLELEGFKKHKSAKFDFTAGSNMIIGPNYSGKTSIMEAILVGLCGNSMAPGTAKDLISDGHKDFMVKLTFDTGHTVTRTSKDSSLARAGEVPYAQGHSSVNKAMIELLGVSKDVLLKVFTSAQGSPQMLLDMEGAELQKFIEGVIGIDKLDTVLKVCNKKIASLKDKTEALEYLILSPDDFAKASNEQALLLTGLINLTKAQEEESLILADAKEQLATSSTLLDKAKDTNAKIVYYDSSLKLLEEQLQGKVFQAPLPMEVYEAAFQKAQDQLSAVVRSNKAQSEVNHAHQRYSKDTQELQEALVGYPEITFDGSELPKLEAELSRVQETDREFCRLQERLETAEAIVAGTVIVGTFDQPLPTQEDVDHHRAAWATAKANLEALQGSLNGSKCPTCDRPFEGMDPEALAEHVAKATVARDEAADVYQKVAKDFDDYQTYLTHYNRSREAKQLVELCKSDIAKLPAHRGIYIVSQELQEAKRAAAEAASSQRMRDMLLGKLSRLVKPEGTAQEEQPTEGLEAQVKSAQAALNEATLSNRIILEDNKLIERLELAKSNLVKPEGTTQPLLPLEQQVHDFSQRVVQYTSLLEEYKGNIHKYELQLQPIKSQLESHREAYGKCKDFFDQAKDYTFITQLLTNSRAGFISKAMAIIFGVTTEFTKLATDGDIEEVTFDGGIKYKEKGVLRGKLAASGAQKAIMGLGMKLGVGNLVVSNFGTMLLDEATAAMSPEISLMSSLAMNSLCEQSLSISHRKMDVAGNTIDLGVL